VFKQARATDEETICENIHMEGGTLWIRNMGLQKSRPEKTIDLRNLVLEGKIKWTDKRRNEEDRGIDKERRLWNNIEKRTRWIGSDLSQPEH
jgi:hypothetical protein